jgi:CxxC motif-containing protein
MSTELICITCPMGCHLTVDRNGDGEIQVSGNRCPRGAAYAREETVAPKRVVTATCRTARGCAGKSCEEGRKESLSLPRRVPVRTTAAFPKERIPELLKAIYGLEVELPVSRGKVVLANALGTGIDLVATRSID